MKDFPGLPSNPFSWQDAVEKYDRLVSGRIDDKLAAQIKEAVSRIEDIQVKELTDLLNHVVLRR